MTDILVYGLTQNNLKHVTFRIPKEKITVFTGTPMEMLHGAETLTADSLRASCSG